MNAAVEETIEYMVGQENSDMKYLTEPNGLFMEEDQLCGKVFSANKYKDSMKEKDVLFLKEILSEMDDEIELIENNYERLKIKRDTIKEILGEDRKK